MSCLITHASLTKIKAVALMLLTLLMSGDSTSSSRVTVCKKKIELHVMSASGVYENNAHSHEIHGA